MRHHVSLKFAILDSWPEPRIFVHSQQPGTSPMSSVIEKIEAAQRRPQPKFQPGDRVRVHFQVIEGSRKRTQVFEGIVIKRQGHGVRETFTVRKQSLGVGVERTFPISSPKIEKIEVVSRGDVRRAKLYYLRDRVGKSARVREKRYNAEEAKAEAERMAAELAAVEELAAANAAKEAAEAAAEAGDEATEAGETANAEG